MAEPLEPLGHGELEGRTARYGKAEHTGVRCSAPLPSPCTNEADAMLSIPHIESGQDLAVVTAPVQVLSGMYGTSSAVGVRNQGPGLTGRSWYVRRHAICEGPVGSDDGGRDVYRPTATQTDWSWRHRVASESKTGPNFASGKGPGWRP